MKTRGVRLGAAVAGLSTLVGSWLAAAGTAGAATPVVKLSAPKAVATLPVGCAANSAKVVNSPDGSYGLFGAAPTETLPVAPVPVHADQIINRSGKVIRIFIQDDGKGHGGRRLLEQKQNWPEIDGIYQ